MYHNILNIIEEHFKKYQRKYDKKELPGYELQEVQASHLA
jgi:hypothetical protein